MTLNAEGYRSRVQQIPLGQLLDCTFWEDNTKDQGFYGRHWYAQRLWGWVFDQLVLEWRRNFLLGGCELWLELQNKGGSPGMLGRTLPLTSSTQFCSSSYSSEGSQISSFNEPSASALPVYVCVCVCVRFAASVTYKHPRCSCGVERTAVNSAAL